MKAFLPQHGTAPIASKAGLEIIMVPSVDYF